MISQEADSILIRARAFVEKGWTQNVSARDKNGVICSALSERACSWCLWGSLLAAGIVKAPNGVEDEISNRLCAATGNPNRDYVLWNDDVSRTRADVLALIDVARSAP